VKHNVDIKLYELSSKDFLSEPTFNNCQQDFEMEFFQDVVDFYRQKTVRAINLNLIVEYLFQVNFLIELINLR
jgi:hypothetical protein